MTPAEIGKLAALRTKQAWNPIKALGDTLRGDETGLDARWGIAGLPLTDAASLPMGLLAKGMARFGLQSRDPAGYAEMLKHVRNNGVSVSMESAIRSPNYEFPAHHINMAPKFENAGVLGHEFGHAMGNKNWIRGQLFSKAVAPFGSLASLLLKDETNSRNAAIAGTAASLPMLGSEIDASVRGARAVRGLGLKGGWRAFGGLPTYAAATALPMVAHYTKKTLGGFDNRGPKMPTSLTP